MVDYIRRLEGVRQSAQTVFPAAVFSESHSVCGPWLSSSFNPFSVRVRRRKTMGLKTCMSWETRRRRHIV